MTGSRIKFITRKWPPAMGGMETYSIQLFEGLSAKFNTELFALPGKSNGDAPSPAQLLVFGVRSAFELLIKKPSEITHIADMASWPLGLAAQLRSRKTRVVLSAHGTDVTYPRRGGWKAKAYAGYLRAGAKLLRAPVVIANSRFTAKTAHLYGYTDVCVVPLATDISRAKNVGFDPDALLFAGRLTPQKGCAWFIRAVLPLLPEEVILQVAGTIWDPDEQAALKHPRVVYLGKLDRDDLTAAFVSVLAVVMPNIEVPTGEVEGFGLIATEAASAGGIPLAANRGGLTDAVVDGVTGFLLPEADAEAWADRINELRNWPEEKRRSFVNQAVSEAKTQYSWARVITDTLAAYGIDHG